MTPVRKSDILRHDTKWPPHPLDERVSIPLDERVPIPYSPNPPLPSHPDIANPSQGITRILSFLEDNEVERYNTPIEKQLEAGGFDVAAKYRR